MNGDAESPPPREDNIAATLSAKLFWVVAWSSFWFDVSLHIASLLKVVPDSLTFDAHFLMFGVTVLGMMPAIGLEATKTGFFAGNFWLARALRHVPWRWRLIFIVIGFYFFWNLYYSINFESFDTGLLGLRFTSSFMLVFAWTSIMYYRAWFKDILAGKSIRPSNQSTPIE